MLMSPLYRYKVKKIMNSDDFIQLLNTNEKLLRFILRGVIYEEKCLY